MCHSYRRYTMRKLSFFLLLYFFLIPICNSQSCVNWLHTPSFPSSVSVGDLDVTGNQITIEVNFNSIALSSNGSWGHIVSKHTGASNVNYALSSNAAEITTSNGYQVAFETCPIQLNKTYHTALVYDGATLKFYRNGFLLNQVPCTGNLVNNDLLTTISQIAGTPVSGEQFTGYVNEVRIWNVARTQTQLQTYMNSSLPNPTTQAGLLGYYTFDNLLNKQGNVAFNGTINGPATINNTNPNCAFVPDSCGVVAVCTPLYDFSYQQNICNPLSVQFFSAGLNPVNPYWSFGDGNTNMGNSTPTNVYPAYGDYTIKYYIDNANCPDTITKIISLQLSNEDIVITPDTTICFGTSKLLRAQRSDNFCWSPTTYLINPNSPTPTTSAPVTTTYYYTSEVTGNNVVVNGNFSSGNTGFTSDYLYALTNTASGEYFVGQLPSTWNPTFTNCALHGPVNSRMFMVNGSTTADAIVWKQPVNITPNTNYVFSTWITSLSAQNAAQLSFAIDDIPVGNIITASQPPCSWNQFYITWNSGNKTSIVLSIINQNTAATGNDFALSEITFAPVSVKRDSVKVTVENPVIAISGTTLFCSSINGSLSASGSPAMASYSWSPATGLSNPNISNPIVTGAAGITVYTVTGTTTNGCVAQQSVSVQILPSPVITITDDTTICNGTSIQLLASGGANYSWTPATTLDNSSIPNPVATPTQPVTKYYVTVINAAVNGCDSKDSVTVTLKPLPSFTISPAKATCQGTPVQLVAGGGNRYAWSPVAVVSNSIIANPFANANTTTNYSVLITDTICNISTTLSTLITVNPVPQVTAAKSNDIDCSLNFSNLLATGAQQYTWSPVTGLSNSNIYNPIAKPVSTTQYIVTGTNTFGCIDADTLTVAVTTAGKSGYYMPNTFSPNGDGKNDCFGIRDWGIVQQLEFIIYNRYGERVFYTTDPNKCWNGLYKSNKPTPGNYVYYIKAVTTCGPVEKKDNIILIR